MFSSFSPLWSQPPPPSGHGQTGNQTPAPAAPVGNGTSFLLGMAALYSVRKIYMLLNKEQ
jgi:hypothetical protein